MEPKKPTFIIIGCQKCGTTALHSILGAHPDCCMSEPKEVSFFQANFGEEYPDRNYEKGWEWYRTFFSHYQGEPVVGEASPSYSNRAFTPKTAERIRKFDPGMKIIYMVRHPLERQVSSWRMCWIDAQNGATYIYAKAAIKGFDHWMRFYPEGWSLCRYQFQLEGYLEYFPRNQILVSFLEDWKADRPKELKRIMHFLGLDPQRHPGEFRESANRAAERTVTRPFMRPLLKRIPGNRLASVFIHCFPVSWRERVKNYSQIRVTPPAPDLTEETRTEFVNYVKSDAGIFLKEWGKPAGFWTFDISHGRNENGDNRDAPAEHDHGL